MRPAADARAPLPIAFRSALSRPLKTAEATARDIVNGIVEAGLQSGDMLASEAEMLEQYGVSRQSLREALRLLEVQGLIELRRGPGGGPVVGTVDAAHFGQISSLFYHLAGVSYEELVDAWAYAEGQLAMLAAASDDRAGVRAALAPFLDVDHHATADPEEYVDLHSRFHFVVAELCGNRALQLTFSSYGLVVAHHLLADLDPLGMGDTVETQHREIARAIISGRSRHARELSEAHVHAIVEHFRRTTSGSLDGLVEWR